ncbi:hypothetical protein M2265_002588 [Sphingobacterium kitahiroshimense]|jgi:hypothetical protein|nr:hypothetical protein [Sphingobacterium kitahiroshimense]
MHYIYGTSFIDNNKIETYYGQTFRKEEVE